MDKYLSKLFESKKKFHEDMANLPFEEKIKIIVELQKIDLEMRKTSGRKIKPYEMVWQILLT